MAEPVTSRTIFTEEIYSIPPPVTVVLGVPWKGLREDDRQLLSNILQAIRSSVSAVRIIHLENFDLSSFTEKPTFILAFVKPTKGLNAYEVIRAGGTTIVFCDALDVLGGDKALKVKLWDILRSLLPA